MVETVSLETAKAVIEAAESRRKDVAETGVEKFEELSS